jgi:AraC-like DNA-binding protein
MHVSILVVRGFLEAVAERGVTRDQFLVAAGIDPGRLENVDEQLTIAEFDRLHEAALALTGDPALGIHMGERVTAQAYDIIGYLGAHASTLREGIVTLFRYGRLVSDVTASLEERDDVASMVFEFKAPVNSPVVRMRAEFTVTGFVRLLRTFCGESAMPLEVLFPYAAPPYRAEYARVFGGRERFEQPITAIRFDRAMLSQEAVHKNPRLSAILVGEAERVLDRLERSTTHAERVRDLLALRGVSELRTMEAVARELGVSVRSLRRRLAEEGVSFPKLLEEAQLASAKRLLENSDRSIYDVAVEMGFSDPSAFHRAFRRWTGMTPSQYRASLR